MDTKNNLHECILTLQNSKIVSGSFDRNDLILKVKNICNKFGVIIYFKEEQVNERIYNNILTLSDGENIFSVNYHFASNTEVNVKLYILFRHLCIL